MIKLKKKHHFIQALISVTVFLLGILTGPILEQRVTPFISSENLSVIIFLLLILVLGTSITLWGLSQSKVSDIENHLNKLSGAIGNQVRILPYAIAYQELIEKIENAHSEIRILTQYVFDWENVKPIYDAERLNHPVRKKVYKTLNTKIQEKSNSSDFEFVRIIEIPTGHSLEEIFPHDEVYREHCLFVSQIAGGTRPEFARVRVSDVFFDRTFAIIDQEFLYMEFEIRDPKTGEYSAPFSLIVEDQDSNVIGELQKLHQRIDASSSLFTAG